MTRPQAEDAAQSLCDEVNGGDNGRVFLAGVPPAITEEDSHGD